MRAAAIALCGDGAVAMALCRWVLCNGADAMALCRWRCGDGDVAMELRRWRYLRAVDAKGQATSARCRHLEFSPAVSYGRKKQNHEVIEHILSVSVRKRGDLEIATKSAFTSFCSW